jgi:hypothetical protein
MLFPFDPELTAFCQNYLREPSPNKALDQFFSLDVEEFKSLAIQDNDPSEMNILVSFYSHILYDNPNMATPFAKQILAEAQGFKVVLGAFIIAQSGHKEALKEVMKGFEDESDLKQQISIALEELVFDCPMIEADHPLLLDMLWACFFASGKVCYLEEITTGLGHSADSFETLERRIGELNKTVQDANLGEDSEEFKELMRLVTAYTAYWSLEQNAIEYPYVLEPLRKLSRTSSVIIADKLKQIVDDAIRYKIQRHF